MLRGFSYPVLATAVHERERYSAMAGTLRHPQTNVMLYHQLLAHTVKIPFTHLLESVTDVFLN